MDRFIIRTPRNQTIQQPRAVATTPTVETGDRPAKRQRLSDEDTSTVKFTAMADLDTASVISDCESIHLGHDSSFFAGNDGGAEVSFLTPLESTTAEAGRSEDEAIAEYEALRSSQAEQTAGKIALSWSPGQSSIYVDAFNLALDTVLEDEAHLFSAAERNVFKQWRQLNYEAQYL